MDTEVKSLANIKAMEGRNLDSSVDGNTLVSGEKADGTFGVFNFFKGIRNFFKGISALGTLASGSRLPVTDANGNVTYTTMNEINNYVVNNALTNYLKITNVLNDNDDLNTLMSNGRYQIASKKVINAPTDFYATEKIYGFLDVQKYENYTSQILTVYIEGVVHIAGRRHTAGATWSEWKKLTTETDLSNFQTKFSYVTSTEVQLEDNATYIVYSHHPYTNEYNYYGFVLNYNGAITDFVVSNSNASLPYTKNGTKLTFKGGYWITRIQKIASSLNGN